MLKIEQKELDLLNTLISNANKQKELILLAELKILELQENKQNTFLDLQKANSALQNELDVVNKKYGEINIDLETGEFKKINN